MKLQYTGEIDIQNALNNMYEGNKERITSKVSGALVIPKNAEKLDTEPESA